VIGGHIVVHSNEGYGHLMRRGYVYSCHAFVVNVLAMCTPSVHPCVMVVFRAIGAAANLHHALLCCLTLPTGAPLMWALNAVRHTVLQLMCIVQCLIVIMWCAVDCAVDHVLSYPSACSDIVVGALGLPAAGSPTCVSWMLARLQAVVLYCGSMPDHRWSLLCMLVWCSISPVEGETTLC
jgi:hypothetical protein